MLRTLRHIAFLSLALLLPAAEAGAVANQPVLRRDCVEVRTALGVFRFRKLMIAVNGPTVSVSGTVTNDTERDWRHASFAVTLFDSAGREILLRPAPRGPRHPHIELAIDNLAVGRTHYFHEDDLQLQRRAVPANFAIVPDGTSQPEYQFVLVEPESVFPWTYSDDLADFVFTPSTSRLAFTVVNTSAEALTIDWEKSAYMDPNGALHRIIHNGVRLVERAQAQLPTTVAPGAEIQEVAYPADAVVWLEKMRYWQEPDLFPPTGYEGKNFALALSVTTRSGLARNYVFRFQIN
ncbi:MAG TPA: hypothetical protein VE998_04025 [Terriglobales bacterium]|nr:hypothetical protein [Terriglobales bacterium]